MQLIITATASADLRVIHQYIKKDNPKAAIAFTEDLTGKLFSPARSGVTGAPRDWVSTGLRVFSYKNRCFYFRVVGDQMRILRVLHDRQDISSQDFPRILQ